MRSTILNREFQHPADGWYQIEPAGEHLNRAGGVVQVIDDMAVQSIVNRFNTEADDYQRQHGQPFPGMLIDHEHFKHQPDKESIAYGWLMRLQNKNGGVYGQINWTNTGKPRVDGGDYRFFSTEYDHRDLVTLSAGQPRRARPTRLDGLTLTNEPNNKGGAPITNRTAPHQQHTSLASLRVPAIFSRRVTPSKAPPLTGHAELDILNTVVSLVRNRVGYDYQTAFNLVLQHNADLVGGSSQGHLESYAKVLNRAQTGSVSQIVSRLTNRFSPAMSVYQASLQWDALSRAAAVLEQAGVPECLLNRKPNDPEVKKADWKKANQLEQDALAQFDDDKHPIDYGASPVYQGSKQACIIRGTFKGLVQGLMNDEGLTPKQAFDRIKNDQPIFWTLSMLAFDPELEPGALVENNAT